MLSKVLTRSKRVIWTISRGEKTHVRSQIPALDREQSHCTVHYNMCASHLGGTLTVISVGAEAVFPGSTTHLEEAGFSWMSEPPSAWLKCCLLPQVCVLTRTSVRYLLLDLRKAERTRTQMN